jgi:hypothetical protein
MDVHYTYSYALLSAIMKLGVVSNTAAVMRLEEKVRGRTNRCVSPHLMLFALNCFKYHVGQHKDKPRWGRIE